MKPLAVTLLLLTFCSFCHAQISKGSILLGGSLSFSISDSKMEQSNESENSYFSIQPSFGYMISNELMLGISPGYSYSLTIVRSYNSGNLQSTNTTESYTLNAGPFVRYYLPIAEKLNFFTHAEFRYGLRNAANELIAISGNDTYDFSDSNIAFNLYPGIIFFVTNRIGIEASFGLLSYTYSMRELDTNADYIYESSDFNLSFNPSQLGLGINYYFTR